jgi:hypothetical protein
MTNPFFSGRISQGLLDHVEKHRESTGESKTDVLVKALAAYTGFEDNDKTDLSGFKIPEVLERLERLESEVFGKEVEPKALGVEERQYNLDFEKVVEAEEKPEPKTQEGETEILTTSEMVERGVVKNRRTLSDWNKEEGFPKTYKGFLINKATEKERDQRKSGKKGKPPSCWRVTPV